MKLGRPQDEMPYHVGIATPVSHLFREPEDARRISKSSDLLEIRDPSQVAGVSGAALYHCELSLVAPWDTVELQALAGVAGGLSRVGGHLEAVSFHLASRYRVNEIRDGAFVGSGTPMDAQALLSTALDNMDVARRTFPGVPIMVENNNHLGTDAYDVVTDSAFIEELTSATDTGLLLDIAHARITAANTGLCEEDYLSALPLQKVWQVHLSRHAYRDGHATDAHDALAEEDWRHFADLSMKIPNLRWATIEYYQDVNRLLEQTTRLRSLLSARNR